jgi:uncharacterized membrane protein
MLMKLKKILLTLLLIFSIAGQTHAVEYRSYKIIAEVTEDAVSEELVITLLNDGSGELTSGTVSVPEGSEILSVRDSYGELTYTASSNRGIKIDFSFDVPVKQGEERIVIINLFTDSLVTKKDGYFEYLLVLTPKSDIPDFEHVLKLPSDAELYSPKESFSLIVPEGGVAEDGTITWKVKLYANMPEVFLARYRTDDSDNWRTVLLVFFGIFAVIVSGILVKRAITVRQQKKTLDSLSILNERERRVLEVIVKKEGIKQYELLDELGYTKASLSKILTRLEARGLVRKKKFGKVNRLYPGEKL